MNTVLVFGITLFAAVLVSDRARRTVLSTAVLFLAAGFVAGEGVLEVMPLVPGDPLVATLADLALFAVLFTDGMKVGLGDLGSAWRLPGRALLLGLPLNLLLTAALAWGVAGLPWDQALLLGAVLSPTDPVFAAAIVGRKELPWRLRHLLNVESGLNDGLALPIVVALLALAGPGSLHPGTLLVEMGLGVAIGVGAAWTALALERSRFFAASPVYRPLNVVAIGIVVFGLAHVTRGNEYLAAFGAGATVASIDPGARDAFHSFGEIVAELLKLAALLVFGALLSPAFLADVPLGGYLFAVLALVVARPLAIVVALAGSSIDRRELAVAAWFGPRGFASVVYALLILDSGIADAGRLFHLAAVAVSASILAHSSTDVLVARWFERGEAPEGARPPVEGVPSRS